MEYIRKFNVIFIIIKNNKYLYEDLDISNNTNI